MISYLAGPMLGNAKMGLIADHYGVRPAITSGGILCVIAILALAAILPKFLRYDGREGVKQKEIEEAAQGAGTVEIKI